MFSEKKTDAIASDELVNQSFKERIVLAAKGGFLLFTGVLAVQIFMKAVYFANL